MFIPGLLTPCADRDKDLASPYTVILLPHLLKPPAGHLYHQPSTLNMYAVTSRRLKSVDQHDCVHFSEKQFNVSVLLLASPSCAQSLIHLYTCRLLFCHSSQHAGS